MFGKFLLKNGYGSPGHTAKTLIEHFNRRNQFLMANNPNEIYSQILLDRMPISLQTAQSYYDRLKDFEIVMDFIEDDICTFCFLILFSESQKFREGVRPDRFGDSEFDLVTQVIFEVCRNRSSLSRLSLDEFKNKADKICRLHIYRY